jgi:hypothetical protein
MTPSSYTLIQEQNQALTNCFWFNFKNSLKPEKANFKLTDTVLFYSLEGQIGNIGIRTSFDFELLYLNENSNSLNIKIYYQADNDASLSIKAFDNLLSISVVTQKKTWNHFCVLQYQQNPRSLVEAQGKSKNRFSYEVFLNDQQKSVSLDLLDIGKQLLLMYPITNYDYRFSATALLSSLRGSRSLSNVNGNGIFSDFKLFKFTKDVAARKDIDGNLVSLPDERLIRNLFYSAKFFKFAKFSDDSLLIGSSIDSTVLDSFAKGFNLLTPLSAPELILVDNYKFLDFFNLGDSNSHKIYNSIFQIGFPKIIVLENFIKIQLMFEGDFIIKAFQRAALGSFEGKNFELDLEGDLVDVEISDFERKSIFAKSLDFYELQSKFDFFFLNANINLENKFAYHFIISLVIRNSLNLNTTVKKESFEFKLFVGHLFNFNNQKISLFVNDGISSISNFDRNYILPKTTIFPIAVELASKDNFSEFIKNSFLDVNKINESYYFYKNFPITHLGSIFFYNLKFNQALDFQQSITNIYQRILVPFLYNQISVNYPTISFRFDKKTNSNSYSKRTFTLYSVFNFSYNENNEMQMLKPYMNSFESTFQVKDRNTKTADLNLSIPFNQNNIQILPERNHYAPKAQCLMFTIKTKDQFNIAKEFKVISDEPNLIIKVFYIKSYKNSATYCLNIDRVGLTDTANTLPLEYENVFSFSTQFDLNVSTSIIDPSAFFHVKFLPVDEQFFNKINYDINSNSLKFTPVSILFFILIQRVSAEILYFDFNNATQPSCVLHMKSNLFPSGFKEESLESNLLKPELKTKVDRFSQLEPNLFNFSPPSLDSLNPNLSTSIFSLILPYEEKSFDYGKTGISVIKSCLSSQIISLIKTDYRDIYFDNSVNSEIVFSVFESKATFVFNKHCYISYTQRWYSTGNFEGTSNGKISIINDILAIDILNIRSITFEFESKSSDGLFNLTVIQVF